MPNCLFDLELHFSNLASFVIVLFDAKIVGVCTIHIDQPKIRGGDSFPIFGIVGMASI